MLNNLIGHQNIWEYLKTAYSAGNLAQGYLLNGPAHIGKSTLAERFSALLLCEAKTSEPCGICQSCRLIKASSHPDLVLVKKADDRTEILIEQIRDLKKFLTLKSWTEASYRIAIISESELMNTQAANALLKILEEPPERSMIFILTSQLKSLPETVSSRCQTLFLNNVPRQEIISALTAGGASVELAESLAVSCQGRPGLALNWLENSALRSEELNLVTEIINWHKPQSFQNFESWWASNMKKDDEGASQVDKTKNILSIWQKIVRDLIFLKLNLLDKLNYQTSLNEVQYIMSGFTLGQGLKWANNLNQAENALSANVNPRLILEWLLLKNSNIEIRNPRI